MLLAEAAMNGGGLRDSLPDIADRLLKSWQKHGDWLNRR
jgi:hypothetical protein